jgi:hypothetical protein
MLGNGVLLGARPLAKYRLGVVVYTSLVLGSGRSRALVTKLLADAIFSDFRSWVALCLPLSSALLVDCRRLPRHRARFPNIDMAMRFVSRYECEYDRE